MINRRDVVKGSVAAAAASMLAGPAWSRDESARSGGNLFFDFFRNTRWNRTLSWIK